MSPMKFHPWKTHVDLELDCVLDGKIKIWATLPILQPEYDDSVAGVDASVAPAKKLCTLSMHAGVFLGKPRWLTPHSDTGFWQVPCSVFAGLSLGSG